MGDDERILPLINVVFLLLIFFMLAGQLAATDPFRIEPPESASGAAPGANEAVVMIAADGRLALNGTVVDDAALKREIAGRDGAVEVRVKADGGAPAVRVVEVMEILRDAGLEKLRLLTVPAQ